MIFSLKKAFIGLWCLFDCCSLLQPKPSCCYLYYINFLKIHHFKFKVINLTKAGQVKLSAFSAEALLFASDNYKFTKNVRDPFQWIFKMCLEYCERNDIKPDWQFSYRLAEARHVAKDAPLVRDGQKASLLGCGRCKKSPTQPVLVEPRAVEYWQGDTVIENPFREKSKTIQLILDALRGDNPSYALFSPVFPLSVQLEASDLLVSENSCYCGLLTDQWK